jgi:hypothetical protein
VIGQGV